MKNSINLITLLFVSIIGLFMSIIQLTNNDINRIPKLIDEQKLTVDPNFKLYLNDVEIKDEPIQKIGLIINDLKELKQQFRFEYDKKKDEYDLTLDYHLFTINSTITLTNEQVIVHAGRVKTRTKSYCEN